MSKCLRLITSKLKQRLHSEAKKRPVGQHYPRIPVAPTAAMLICRFGAKSSKQRFAVLRAFISHGGSLGFSLQTNPSDRYRNVPLTWRLSSHLSILFRMHPKSPAATASCLGRFPPKPLPQSEVQERNRALKWFTDNEFQSGAIRRWRFAKPFILVACLLFVMEG